MSTRDTPRPVNFAYVGCGFLAQKVHIPNFAAVPGCRFLALAEARHELGNQVAAHYGIDRTYRSHHEIAEDAEIEAVGVSAPYALQGRIALDLLNAGKHVFMEKPMAVSSAGGEALVAAARRGPGRLMVGYMKRYDRGNLLLKSHLDAWREGGEHGRLLYARNHGFGGNWVAGADPNVYAVESTATAPPPPDDCPAWLPERWHLPYLGYLQQWTHNANLLRFFLGDDGGKTKVRSVHLDDDGMTGLVVLNINGTRAVMESAYTNFHAWDEHTQIYFEGGWLKTHAPAILHKQITADVEIYEAGRGAAAPRLTCEYAAPSWAFYEEAVHFLDCVRSGAPFRSSAEDTLNDVRLFEEIYRHVIAS